MKPPVDFVGQEMEIGFASKDSISHYMISNFIEELNLAIVIFSSVSKKSWI